MRAVAIPNHVSNLITAPRKVALALLRGPTTAEITAHEHDHQELASSYRKRTGKEWTHPLEPLPEQFVDFELAVPSPPNKEKGNCSTQHAPGVICWHSWNVENWSTKWNAYSSEIVHDIDGMMTIKFDTAWSHPFPVVAALSRRFPDDTIRVDYADENLGYNLSRYVMRNGEIVKEEIPEPGSPEALDMAAQIKYGKSYAQIEAEWAE